MQGRMLTTMLIRLWSEGSTSTANFVPATGPISTTQIDTGRVSRWLEGATTNATVVPAYRMSEDGGLTWSSTITEIGSYDATAGWVSNDSTVTTVSTDQKLYVQFGFNVKNGTGTAIESAQGKLRIAIAPTNGQSVMSGEHQVWSDGSTTEANAIFFAITPMMARDGMGEIRATIRLGSSTGNLTVKPAYQVSNDGVNWYSGVASASEGSFKTFGSSRSTEGTTYGTTFDSSTDWPPAEKKQYIRWGVACWNSTGSVIEVGLVDIRVDTRS